MRFAMQILNTLDFWKIIVTSHILKALERFQRKDFNKISKNRILAVHRRFAHRFNKEHFQRKWPPIFRANNRWVQLSSSISYNTSGRHQLWGFLAGCFDPELFPHNGYVKISSTLAINAVNWVCQQERAGQNTWHLSSSHLHGNTLAFCRKSEPPRGLHIIAQILAVSNNDSLWRITFPQIMAKAPCCSHTCRLEYFPSLANFYLRFRFRNVVSLLLMLEIFEKVKWTPHLWRHKISKCTF